MEGVCRVCLLKTGDMLNIFDGTPESSISIAEIIAQYTGFEVIRGDSFPQTVCSLCLQDARNMLGKAKSIEHHLEQVHFQMKREFRESENCHMVTPDWPTFECQIKKEDPDSGEELLEEQVCELSDSESRSSSSEEDSDFQLNFQIKEEKDENDSTPKQQIKPQFDVIVKTERIDEDLVEEGISADAYDESKSDQYFDFVVKEEQEEYIGADEVNGNRPYKCTYCPNRYSRKANLNIHIRTHTGKQPYKCSVCQKIFNVMQALKQHFRIHTGERPHKCGQCGKAFRTQTDMRHHVLIHSNDRPHKCTDCPRSFVKRSRLKKHMRTHRGERTFNCSRCPAEFPLKELRREHSRTHRKPKDECLQCPECPKVLPNKSSLRTHLKSHSVDRPFVCSQCSNTFKEAPALRIHMLTHSDQKSYPCPSPNCSKAFKQQQSLRRHQITSHNAVKKCHLNQKKK